MGDDRAADSAAGGYWQTLEPFWDRIDIYNGPERFLATYGPVPMVVRTLYAAHFSESEISNGGLHQFFLNPTGVLAPEAVEAFRNIGLADAAAVIERAMAFFGTPYPRVQEQRVARLESIPGDTREEYDPFFELDTALDRLLGPDHQPFYDALDAWNAAHS